MSSSVNESIKASASFLDWPLNEANHEYFTASRFSIILLLTFGLAFLTKSLFFSGRKSRLPPGPNPSPIIGNLLQVLQARKKSAHGFQWLSELASYGEFTTLQMGAQTWVLLNSSRAANEIIVKRAAITSQRPFLPVAQGLISHDRRSVLRQTKDWQAGRKLMQHMLSGTALRGYGQIQDQMSVIMLQNYLDSPERWYQHSYRYAYDIIHRIVVGKQSEHTQHGLDEFARITVEFVKNINASIMDYFPWLSRLPTFLQPGYTHWKAIGDDHYRVIQDWWTPVKVDLASPNPTPSFVSSIMMADPKFANDDKEAMYLATSVVAAGSDNVRTTINSFFFAIAHHPEILSKARSYLDVVCGSNAERLPTLADIDSLPYIHALIKETLRWRPTIPVTPQHRLTSDLEFEGYSFPAGTDFIINEWAVSAECEDADEFRPERWEGENVGNILNGNWQFGGGRRVCVGYGIARQELFLAVARGVYCFDVKVDGVRGDNSALRNQVIDESVPIRFMIRSKEHERLIRRSMVENATE